MAAVAISGGLFWACTAAYSRCCAGARNTLAGWLAGWLVACRACLLQSWDCQYSATKLNLSTPLALPLAVAQFSSALSEAARSPFLCTQSLPAGFFPKEEEDGGEEALVLPLRKDLSLQGPAR